MNTDWRLSLTNRSISELRVAFMPPFPRAAAPARPRTSSRPECLRSSGPGSRPESLASVMPEAKYSSTSDTVMRMPRTHGFPLRFPGSTVIRSCRWDSMSTIYDGRRLWAKVRPSRRFRSGRSPAALRVIETCARACRNHRLNRREAVASRHVAGAEDPSSAESPPDH